MPQVGGRARARWSLLARRIAAIQGGGTAADNDGDNDEEEVSVRRFKHYQLAVYGPHDALVSDKGAWRTVRFPALCGDTAVCDIHVVDERAAVRSLADLTGFNNTGNVCVWPSEEVMAFYCLRHRAEFAGRRVLEVGAGMAGLAAFALASSPAGGSDEQTAPALRPSSITVTDGNARSVLNLHRIAKADDNRQRLQGVPVHIGELQWSALPAASPHYCRYDTVLAADCLFFDEARAPLLALLATALRPGGVFVSLAPARNGTARLFADMLSADERFCHVSLTGDFDEVVTGNHRRFMHEFKGVYEPALHYPILLTAKRSSQ